jgi:erythromycin esterase
MQQFATLRCGNVNYNDERDQYMAENIQWINTYETVKGNDHLFITGHNGHIEKSSASLATHTCMGKYLTQLYGEAYYAIGTDFYSSTFNAYDTLSETYKVFNVTNKNNSIVNAFVDSGKEKGLIQFSNIKNEATLKVLDSKQAMGNIGNEFNSITGALPTAYTIKMVPSQAYNALIIIKKVSPTSFFD